MRNQHQLTQLQINAIDELLSTIAPDFAETILKKLHEEMNSVGTRNPVAFVRYSVLAVRQGRFGPNRGLHIPRTRMAATGADRHGSARNDKLTREG